MGEEMTVDLSISDHGLFTLDTGEVGWSLTLACADGTYSLRYESGWYMPYSRDGTRLHGGYIAHTDGSFEQVKSTSRNITKFEPCEWQEGMNWGFHP